MNFKDFSKRYGPWALVAGASEGLGAEFAQQLAARGLNVLAIGLDRERLESVASEIRATHGVDVRPVVLDLGGRDVAREIDDRVRDIEIGLLVYNAAFAPVGRFTEQKLGDGLKALDVNCRGPLVLAHRLAPEMLARRRGGILLLASMAAFHGTSMVATYAATKAFNLVLAEGLWSELRGGGVDVLACCPGATRTPGYLRSNPRGSLRPMDPSVVVTETLEALGRRSSLIAGRSNRVAQLFLSRLLPRETAIKLVSRATRRMYDQK